MKLSNIFKVSITILFIGIIIYHYWTSSSSLEEFNSSEKYVCMYAYYEKNDEYKEHLSYFLENGIIDEIDYYIIVNGKCTVNIPQRKNIKVIIRENRGFDFGAWQHCIKHEILPNKYDYYIFLNSSVRGPIGVEPPLQWHQKFRELFDDGPDIKIVGTTINVLMNTWKEYPIEGSPPYTHVQTMFFMLNREGFDFLLERGFFDDEDVLNNTTDMKYMVTHKEIGMSRLILKNGWNINALVPKYRGKDYRTITKNFNPSSESPYNVSLDPPDKKCYFGEDIKPKEVIFYKTNVSSVT